MRIVLPLRKAVLGGLLLLGVLCSWVGPVLLWVTWPPSSQSTSEAEFLRNLVTMLWPTRILALGTPHLTPGGIALLVGTNIVLYIAVETLVIATFLFAGGRKLYPLVLVLALPTFWQLWGAGFDLKFVEWASFSLSLVFYGSIGFVALSLCGSQSNAA